MQTCKLFFAPSTSDLICVWKWYDLFTVTKTPRKTQVCEDSISWKFLCQMEIKRSFRSIENWETVLYIFLSSTQETVRELIFFRHAITLAPFGTYGFGSVWKHLPKIRLVGCVARSVNFFYLFPGSFKGNNFGREYQEKVIIKAEQNKTPITMKRGRLRRQRYGWKRTLWLSCIQKLKEKVSLALLVILEVSMHLKKKKSWSTNKKSSLKLIEIVFVSSWIPWWWMWRKRTRSI